MPLIPYFTRPLEYCKVDGDSVLYRVTNMPIFGDTNDSSINIPKSHFPNVNGPYPDKMVMEINLAPGAIWNKH